MAFAKPVKAGDKVKSTAPLLDEGVYPARILSIVDLGMQPGSPQYPEEKLKLEFRFELLDEFNFFSPGSVIFNTISKRLFHFITMSCPIHLSF